MFVPICPIDNMSPTLVPVKDWRQIGDKSLPGPTMTRLNIIISYNQDNVLEPFMRHSVSIPQQQPEEVRLQSCTAQYILHVSVWNTPLGI